MSGLYTVLFGVSPTAGPLLHSLGLDHRQIDRFRDCFLFHDGKSVVVYTRTGGGNRSEYAESNDRLRAHPSFLRDEDDRADETYALFHFSVPEDVLPHVPLAMKNGHAINPTERWRTAIDSIGRVK